MKLVRSRLPILDDHGDADHQHDGGDEQCGRGGCAALYVWGLSGVRVRTAERGRGITSVGAVQLGEGCRGGVFGDGAECRGDVCKLGWGFGLRSEERVAGARVCDGVDVCERGWAVWQPWGVLDVWRGLTGARRAVRAGPGGFAGLAVAASSGGVVAAAKATASAARAVGTLHRRVCL